MIEASSLTVLSRQLPPMHVPGALALVVLAGCSQSAGPPSLAVQCTSELNPPGSYSYQGNEIVPTAIPAENGTAEGAAAMNACIQRKAAEAGIIEA